MAELPRKPERPQQSVPDNSGNRRRSSVPILLAVVAGLFLAGTFAMFFLAALGPIGIAALAMGVLIFVVVGLQYLVWGWWLGPAIRRDAEIEAEAEKAEAERPLAENDRQNSGQQHQ